MADPAADPRAARIDALKAQLLLKPVPSPVERATDLADALVAFLTGGYTGPEVADLAANAHSPLDWQTYAKRGRMDLPTHALTSQLIAQNLGPRVADAIGTGQEYVQGATQFLRGRGFYSDPKYGGGGYDPEDVTANRAGIDAFLKGARLNLPRLKPAK